MNWYTAIAYHPDVDDDRQRRDSRFSQFEMYEDDNADYISTWMSTFLSQNMRTTWDTPYCWEVTLLINGKSLNTVIFESDEHNELYHIQQTARLKAEELHKQYLVKKEEERQAKILKQEQAKIAQELELYNKLQQKYGK